MLRALAICVALAPTAASASGFSVIASVPGGPQIGAVRGGTLYGTVAYNGAGQLFRLSTSGKAYTLLHDFAAATDGSAPNARLAFDPQGNLFGTASGGGAYGGGTLWEYSAAGSFTAPHAFGNGNDGAVPMQGPTAGPRRTILGTTGEGAIGGSGNIFSLHAGQYNVLYEFMSGADGHCPFSGLAVGPGGALYGTAVGVGFGGNPNGSVWQYTAAGGLKTLYVFRDSNDGEWPDQAPVVDAAGNLYGTTHVQNGSNFAGAIWMITAAGQFSVLHGFDGATDGSGPNSPLLIGQNGTLYGTTAYGGTYGYGTVYSITPAGNFTVIHAFAAGADGAQPTGNLVQTHNGTIYGGTAYGPVFKIVP